MRKVFFLLLVVNLVFLAWQYYQHRAQLETYSLVPDEDGIPSLILLSERQGANQPVARESAQELVKADSNVLPREIPQEVQDLSSQPRETSDEVPDEPEPEVSETDLTLSAPASSAEPVLPRRICHKLGPIADQAQAEALAAVLAGQGVQARWRQVQPREVDSYWVLAPPSETRAETRRLVANLKERGVQDLWIMLRGELKGYISLGIYSRESRARQRQRQLAAYGVDTIIRPRFTELPQYWVDLETPVGPLDENEFLESIQGLQLGLALAPLDCSGLDED